MIDMKCPSCGAGGRIPREKMNTRLVCKKCLRVFHVTTGGNTVLGEPAAPKDQPKAHPAREASRRDTVDRFDDVASTISKIRLPQVQPMTLAVIGGIALLSALGYWFFSRQSIEKRSLDVARAIQQTDMKQVIDLAAPGTEMDAIRWYNDVYRQYMALKIALAGQDAGITVQPPAAPQGGTTQVYVHFSTSGTRFDGSLFNDALAPNPSLSNAKQTLELSLYWMTDMWGNWLLDGTKTYAGPAAK
jgi:hypothetical protein